MQLDIFQFYGQHKVVSKIEQYTDSIVLWCVQISKFDFNDKKLCEKYTILWTIYYLTLWKLFKFFMESL